MQTKKLTVDEAVESVVGSGIRCFALSSAKIQKNNIMPSVYFNVLASRNKCIRQESTFLYLLAELSRIANFSQVPLSMIILNPDHKPTHYPSFYLFHGCV
jgi:hypothetical protein